MPMDGMMNGMGCAFMLLITVLFVAAIIVGVWLVVRAVRGGGPGSDGRPAGPRDGASSAALGILEERYARGEMGHDEFHERRRTLTE